MSYNDLSIPTDIPWKRLGVSKDMIAKKNFTFPEKWKTSIAIFYHEPSKEEIGPSYCNRRITYLKVSCTLTNYQACQDQVEGILGRLRQLVIPYGRFKVVEDLVNTLTTSYPCYGALLQLAVFPFPSQGVSEKDYPYISYFEPKKRELYQTVTENGEVLSQSSSKANVTKGTTSMDTLEISDLDLGGGGSGGASLFGLVSSQQTDPNIKKGTVQTNTTQNQNIRTIDDSREKRENFSYTTQLNQLYTELQSYHLGTNRSVFFMLPRPNYKDNKFTFINGLRRLEGIQDFFFIINRPDNIPGISVEVLLETAHLYNERRYIPRYVTATDYYLPENLRKTPETIGIKEEEMETLFKEELDLIKKWNDCPAFVKYFANKMFRVEIITWNDYKDFTNIYPTWIEDVLICVSLLERAPYLAAHYGHIAILLEEIEYDTGQMFMTARKLKCGKNIVDQNELIPGEITEDENIDQFSQNCSLVYEDPDFYNGGALGRNISIGNAIEKSINSTNRYEYGKIDLTTSYFFTKRLKSLFDKAYPKMKNENDKIWNDLERIIRSSSNEKERTRDDIMKEIFTNYNLKVLDELTNNKFDKCVERLFLSQQPDDRKATIKPKKDN